MEKRSKKQFGTGTNEQVDHENQAEVFILDTMSGLKIAAS